MPREISDDMLAQQPQTGPAPSNYAALFEQPTVPGGAWRPGMDRDLSAGVPLPERPAQPPAPVAQPQQPPAHARALQDPFSYLFEDPEEAQRQARTARFEQGLEAGAAPRQPAAPQPPAAGAPRAPQPPQVVMTMRTPNGFEVPLTQEDVERLWARQFQGSPPAPNGAHPAPPTAPPPANGAPATPLPSAPPVLQLPVQAGDGDGGLFDGAIPEPLARVVNEQGKVIHELRQSLGALQSERDRQARERELETVAERSRAALDSHPFTRGATPEVRESIARLALMDTLQYGNSDGITLEQAITHRANIMAGHRRSALTEEVNGQRRYIVPTPVRGQGQAVMPDDLGGPRTPQRRTLRDFIEQQAAGEAL